ncbi:MAG: hypothetical protein JST00_13535 [Deltaproteobacteria bacterium]|nr:hypothetical protein [Deltaproteobacteria bacterium]
MKRTLISLVGLALAVSACSKQPEDDASSSSGSSGEVSPPDETPPDESSSGTSGSSGDNTPRVFTIESATLRNVGRRGDKLQISVKGTDSAKVTTAARVALMDEAGAPVAVFDTNWDGVADSADRRFMFDTPTSGKKAVQGTITIPDAFSPSSKVKKAKVSLVDENGKSTSEIEATLELQAVIGEGQACDLTKVKSRCQEGLSCGGTPSACQPGAAPELAQVAYFGGSSPRMLFRGAEHDEDLESLEVEFLDSSNNPKTVIIAGEGDTGVSASNFSLSAGDLDASTFFLESQPSPSFTSQVPKIAVTAKDHVGRVSSRVIAAIGSPTMRFAGQPCDADGFDACAAGLACAPGVPGATNTCSPVATVKTQRLAAYAALDPAGKQKTFGVVQGSSLWDAPPGCIPNDATRRPEAMVPLRVGATSNLVITTALPETDFDTAVFVVPAKATSSSASLGCNDDTQGYSSTLELSKVPAGDYIIVVESVSTKGGHFGLSVTKK